MILMVTVFGKLGKFVDWYVLIHSHNVIDVLHILFNLVNIYKFKYYIVILCLIKFHTCVHMWVQKL
jgi:hypothetical protein